MMTPKQRREIARLFTALEYGEQLAHSCAIHQSNWVETEKERRFLRAQARQEAMHAFLFGKAAEWLAPKQRRGVPKPLRDFGRRVGRACECDDLTQTLVGSQVVLEGFGEEILTRLSRGMDHQKIGFARQRRLILQQERSHHAFGLHAIQRRVERGLITCTHVRTLAADFLELAQRMAEELASIFVALDEDANAYLDALTYKLPSWLTAEDHDFRRHPSAQ